MRSIYLCNRKKVARSEGRTAEQAVFHGGNWFRSEGRIRSSTGTYPKRLKDNTTHISCDKFARRKGCGQSGSGVHGVLLLNELWLLVGPQFMGLSSLLLLLRFPPLCRCKKLTKSVHKQGNAFQFLIAEQGICSSVDKSICHKHFCGKTDLLGGHKNGQMKFTYNFKVVVRHFIWY